MSTSFYLIETVGDVEPILHGPLRTAAVRDALAIELRKGDQQEKNGLFPLDVESGGGPIGGYDTRLILGSYSGGFFEPETATDNWTTFGPEHRRL